MGIPTVPIVTDMFVDVVRAAAEGKGLPLIRFSFLPQPIAFQTAEVCREKILGNDPVSGIPFLEQIYNQLTEPLTKEESFEGLMKAEPRPRLLEPDTPEKLERFFYENGWTDGLPIVLPTEERVAAMLKGTSRGPHEYVGEMQASTPHEAWSYDVERVAVNAVMAGAKPDYFPVILAVASTGVTSLFTSTNSWARGIVVNGPIAKEIGMNSAIGAMGPFNEANSAIGRAYTLISKNLGNSKPGVTYMGTQGNPFNYNNMCIAENEEATAEMWEPLHVTKGYKPNESVVSIFNGLHLRQPSGIVGAYGSPQHLSNACKEIYSTGPYYTIGATIMADPLLVADLKYKYGFDSKGELLEYLNETTFLYQREFFELYPSKRAEGLKGIEPYASWLKLHSFDNVPVPKYKLVDEYGPYERPHFPPNGIDIVMVGGQTNLWYYFGDMRYTASASVDEWR